MYDGDVESPAIAGVSPPAPAKKEIAEPRAAVAYRFKFWWALAAILLLAVWSMLTGSVSLRQSAGNPSRSSGDRLRTPLRLDDDILEIEEREKVVRKMWDVYAHGRSTPLPRFWREAFKAAYEDLASDVAEVRNAAVLEIAKMSLGSVPTDPPPVQPTSAKEV